MRSLGSTALVFLGAKQRAMNFQQLRYVREAVRSDLNLTEASNALNTSQSGVSKQIRELEIELGIEIFVRKGKRLTGLTRAGEGVVKIIERVLVETENLKRHAAAFSGERQGRLVIATTHNQARYALPAVVGGFAEEFPGVTLELRQGTPTQAAKSVLKGEADIAIATEALDAYGDLVSFPCFSWRHVAVVPEGHPLAREIAPTLAQIAAYPLITYSPEFSGRSQIDAAFRDADIIPDVRLAAMDADIIKYYARRGLGVGLLSEMAHEPEDEQSGLILVDGSRDLFQPSITKVAIQRGALLHAYAYRFIELFAPHLGAQRLKSVTLERLSLRPATASAAFTIPAFERS